MHSCPSCPNFLAYYKTYSAWCVVTVPSFHSPSALLCLIPAWQNPMLVKFNSLTTLYYLPQRWIWLEKIQKLGWLVSLSVHNQTLIIWSPNHPLYLSFNSPPPFNSYFTLCLSSDFQYVPHNPILSWKWPSYFMRKWKGSEDNISTTTILDIFHFPLQTQPSTLSTLLHAHRLASMDCTALLPSRAGGERASFLWLTPLYSIGWQLLHSLR